MAHSKEKIDVTKAAALLPLLVFDENETASLTSQRMTGRLKTQKLRPEEGMLIPHSQT